MKTLKLGSAKIGMSLFALMLCVSLFAMPSAALANSGSYVFDERGLLSDSEFQTLESQAAALADSYGMGVYFLTTGYMNGLSDPSSSQRTSYATAYYREHQLGLNKASGETVGDGIMLVVAADSRDYVTVAYGQRSYSFSDRGIDVIEDAVTDHLSGNDWYGAAKAFYDNVSSQLAYYDQHDRAQVPLDLFDYVIRLLIVLGIPAVVAFVVVRGDRAAMLTAREASEAGNYLDPASFTLTASNDQFVNTTMMVTPRPQDNDNGGGGGGWGGGGGGGFSSSGGGKF